MKITDEIIYKVQNALYIWLSKFDTRSIELIKMSCDSLNESWGLELVNPVWSLFWPLVFNGVVDHVGGGYYALTEPVCLDFGEYFYFVNYNPKGRSKPTNMVGIFYTEDVKTEHNIKKICSNPLAILRFFPTVKNVVDNFPQSLQDVDLLDYYNFRTKRGIAKLEVNGLTRYFSMPEQMYLRELPSREINPEAFAIAYCYSRAINNEGNGVYSETNMILQMPSFAMPFMLYRVLLLDGMKHRSVPSSKAAVYVFKNISSEIIFELNRILCQSIRYE